jgi:hypothetical protein
MKKEDMRMPTERMPVTMPGDKGDVMAAGRVAASAPSGHMGGGSGTLDKAVQSLRKQHGCDSKMGKMSMKSSMMDEDDY